MEANFPHLQWLSIGIRPRHSNRRTQGATQENEPSTVVRRHFARSDEEEQLIEEFPELYAFNRAAVVMLAEQLFARPLLSRKRGLSVTSAAVLVRSIPRLTTASI